MEDLKNSLGAKKNLMALIILVILILAIPITLYLVKQAQIFKGRAFGSPPMEFLGSGVTEGNPPNTTSQIVQLKLTYGTVPNSTPTPTPNPTSRPGATSTPTPTSAPGSPASEYRLYTAGDPQFSTFMQGTYSPNMTTDSVDLHSLVSLTPPGSVIYIYAQFNTGTHDNPNWVPTPAKFIPVKIP